MLKTASLYVTDCRVSIVMVLLKADHPLSQDEIAKKIKGKSFNKVSIYRTFESLVKAALVHKAYVDKRAAHYELADKCSKKQCHPHFTCTKCGRTHCMIDVSVPLVKDTAGKGFIIQRQQVRLEGLCPKCVA